MQPSDKLDNILSFDIEDWYHPNLAEKELLGGLTLEDRVEQPTFRILNMLDATDNRATFFVLGEVAERFPGLVLEIKTRGHEVASHGYKHNLVYDYTRDQFETDITKGLEILERVTEQKILGYRAPSWSLGKKTPWAWQVLHSLGIEYDSSVFPFKTFLYGDSKAPRFEYEIQLGNGESMKELPPSVMKIFGQRVPFSGGFYFRFLPYEMIKMGITQCNRNGNPAVLYLHPWELDPGQPRLKLAAKDRFIMYVNLKKTEDKLQRLLDDHRFVSIKEYFSQTGAENTIVTADEVGLN